MTIVTFSDSDSEVYFESNSPLYPPNGGAGYTLRLLTRVGSQSVEANTTTLECELFIDKDQSFDGFQCTPVSWSVTIDGVVVAAPTPSGSLQGYGAGGYGAGTYGGGTFNPYDAWPNEESWSVWRGNIDVPHDATGEKTVAVAATYNAGGTAWLPGLMSVAGTLELPQIDLATAPNFSVSPAAVGDPVVVTVDPVDPGFVHDITWEAGNLSGVIATGVTSTDTINWTMPNVISQFQAGDDAGTGTLPVTIKTTTRSASMAVVGSKTTTALVFADGTAPPVAAIEEIGLQQYDIRARQVEWLDGFGGWTRTQILETTSLQMVEVASGTSTLTIKMTSFVEQLPNWAVVDIDVWNGTEWVFTNHRFVMSRLDDDPADVLRMRTWSGIEFVDYELGFLYSRAKHSWKGDKDVAATKDHGASNAAASPGEIMDFMMSAGKDREWGPRMAWRFTAGKTSMGDKWVNNPIERDIAAGTPEMQVLEGMVTDGLVEYSTQYVGNEARLVLKNPGYGADWTAPGTGRIINLSTAPLKTAPHRASVEARVTRVTAQGDESAQATRQIDSFDPQVFGQLEGWVQASGISSDKGAAHIALLTLDASKASVQERTFVLDGAALASPALFPMVTFHVGDWILIPVNSGSIDGKTARDRVAQITVDKQVDSLTVTVLTGQRILTGTAAVSKKVKGMTGGASTGGSGLGMPPPPPASPKRPVPPTILSAVSSGYWDTDGAAKSLVTYAWSAVGTAVGGGSVAVGDYELWTRISGVGDELHLTASIGFWGTSVTIYDLDPARTYDYAVRAFSQATQLWSDFSPTGTIAAVAPPIDIPGPDLADLYTDGLGMIYAVWGGLLGTLPPTSRLAYVTAEVSGDGGATYQTEGTTLPRAGTIFINKTGQWGTYRVRLRGYDRLGNAGDVSAYQTVTVSDPHINPPTPAVPTGLTSTPGTDWGPSGFLPVAWFDLTWTAPTVDVSGNPVVIAGYDIYGLKAGETVERYLTTSATNSVRVPVNSGEEWTFRIKATSQYGGVSGFSSPITDTADAVLPGAPVPDAPTLTQYLGLLTVNWSGGGILPQIKYVYAQVGPSATGPFTRVSMTLLGAGQVVVSNLAPGVYYAQIVMVDQAGTTATSTSSAPITLLPPTGTTIQTNAAPNVGIKLTDASLTAYNASGIPSLQVIASTGEVFIKAYDAVFDLGATGASATTGAAVNGVSISAESSDFNTFIHPSGVQIRRNETALSWWEGDATDGSGLVNFFSPRANIGQRLRVGDYEFLNEAKTVGSRLVIRYKGA